VAVPSGRRFGLASWIACLFSLSSREIPRPVEGGLGAADEERKPSGGVQQGSFDQIDDAAPTDRE